MVDETRIVTLKDETYPVRRTARSQLREVDLIFDHVSFRGVEQNPNTRSRWAQLAREGKKVMQFLSAGRYVANVVEGKATVYQALPLHQKS